MSDIHGLYEIFYFLSRYCAVLGNGRACPPRILFYATDNHTFKSILSMPANCPVRDDIIVSSLTSFPTAFWKIFECDISKIRCVGLCYK